MDSAAYYYYFNFFLIFLHTPHTAFIATDCFLRKKSVYIWFERYKMITPLANPTDCTIIYFQIIFARQSGDIEIGAEKNELLLYFTEFFYRDRVDRHVRVK